MKKTKSPTLNAFALENYLYLWPGASAKNAYPRLFALVTLFPPKTKVTDVSGPLLAKVVMSEMEKGTRPETMKARLSYLRGLLTHAKTLGIIDRVPDFPPVKSRPNPRKVFFSVEQEANILCQLLRNNRPVEAEIFATLIDTGCRPSELLQGPNTRKPIQWNEVSEGAGGTAPDVIGPDHLTCAVININRTKTYTSRTIPLTERARVSFQRSKDRGERSPFYGWTTPHVSRVLRGVLADLGIPDAVLYTTRHTCASRLVQRGGDVMRVKEWMGHSDIKTTLGYAKLNPTDSFKLVDLL